MSLSYQIISQEGQLSQVLPEEAVILALKAGRLLTTDPVQLSTGEKTQIKDVSSLSSTVDSLRAENDLVDAQGLAQAVGRISGSGQTGHLILTGPNGVEYAWSFVQGMLVGIRPLEPSDHHHDNLTERSLTALFVGRSIVDTFSGGAISVRYHEDHTYAPKTPQVYICGAEIVETGLRSGIGIDECLNALDQLGELRRGRLGPDTQVELQRVDRQIIRGIVEYGSGRRAISALAKAIGYDEGRTACRAMTLVHLGSIKAVGKTLKHLEETHSRLQGLDYFQRLGIPTDVDATGIAEARVAAIQKYQVDDEKDDEVSIRKMKASIRRLIDESSNTLSDPMQLGIYKMSLQSGRDFADPNVRQALISEYALNVGRRLIDGRSYQEATDLLDNAIQSSGRDPQLYVYAGWAQFLASEKQSDDATAAADRVRRALEIDRNSDFAHLTLGKIYRLAGQKDNALRHLNKAKELNTNNNEAWQELRLLNSRQANPKSAIKLEIGTTEGMGPLLGYTMLVLALLYVGANLIPGGATLWPMLPQGVVKVQEQETQLSPSLMKKVNERRKEELERDPELSRKIKREIAPEEQVFGNIESFWVETDTWFWVRRAILLFAGLLGIVLISRKKFSEVGWIGTGAGLAFLGILYGVVVGFLSPTQTTPTVLWIVLGMSVFHVIAEQVFFFGFVGKTLLDRMGSQASAIVVTALIYGLHQLTFFSTINIDSVVTLMVGVTQVTAFAGGAYAFLLARTGGLLASTLTHTTVMVVMMLNSVQSGMGG